MISSTQSPNACRQTTNIQATAPESQRARTSQNRYVRPTTVLTTVFTSPREQRGNTRTDENTGMNERFATQPSNTAIPLVQAAPLTRPDPSTQMAPTNSAHQLPAAPLYLLATPLGTVTATDILPLSGPLLPQQQQHAAFSHPNPIAASHNTVPIQPYSQFVNIPTPASTIQSIVSEEATLVVAYLEGLNHRYVEGQILNISIKYRKGLGFFTNQHPLPPPLPRFLPIKVNFSLSEEQCSLLIRKNWRSIAIGGILKIDALNLRHYVYNHPYGSFRQLHTQRARASFIPIELNQVTLTDSCGKKIYSPEIQPAIRHLESLQGQTVSAKVLYFQPANKGGIACYEENGQKVRFLFRLPEEQKEMPIEDLRTQFDRIQAKIDLKMDQAELSDYVSKLSPKVFSDDDLRYQINIYSSNPVLIPKNNRRI